MPIGIAPTEERSFTNHVLDLRKNDLIYIFSDGFADQFGGPEDRKFRYRPFKELLVRIHKQDMGKQKKLLEQKFYNWKGEVDQVDDILIIGFKIQT